MLWTWKKRVVEKGEEHLHEVGRPVEERTEEATEQRRPRTRIAELERLIGRQQMEIRFLDKALRQVEELRQEKNDDGEAASSKR